MSKTFLSYVYYTTYAELMYVTSLALTQSYYTIEVHTTSLFLKFKINDMLTAILLFLCLQAEFGAMSMLYDRNVDGVIAINNLQAPTTMHGNE